MYKLPLQPHFQHLLHCQRLGGLKKVVNSLFRAMPEVGDVTIVWLLVQLVYGLFGMQFLRGHMASCNDPAVQAASLLETLEPHILGGRLTQLSPEVMQAFVGA